MHPTFTNVPDPIGLAVTTAAHLRIGGTYFMANCFQPVIACHLPQLNHLSIGWDHVMSAMGMIPRDKIRYGRFTSLLAILMKMLLDMRSVILVLFTLSKITSERLNKDRKSCTRFVFSYLIMLPIYKIAKLLKVSPWIANKIILNISGTSLLAHHGLHGQNQLHQSV